MCAMKIFFFRTFSFLIANTSVDAKYHDENHSENHSEKPLKRILRVDLEIYFDKERTCSIVYYIIVTLEPDRRTNQSQYPFLKMLIIITYN